MRAYSHNLVRRNAYVLFYSPIPSTCLFLNISPLLRGMFTNGSNLVLLTWTIRHVIFADVSCACQQFWDLYLVLPSIMPGGDPTGTPLENLGQQNGTSVTWIVNLGVGEFPLLSIASFVVSYAHGQVPQLILTFVIVQGPQHPQPQSPLSQEVSSRNCSVGHLLTFSYDSFFHLLWGGNVGSKCFRG